MSSAIKSNKDKESILKKDTVDELNALFRNLKYVQRIEKIYELYDQEDILFTSSFGTNSIFLIDQIHQIKPTQKVHFINTTYHFDETIQYRKNIQKAYNLDIVHVNPNSRQNELTKEEKWWKDHPKMCCTINKIAPLDPIILKHKIWITGLMSNQTNLRSKLDIFEQKGDIIKFYPIIDLERNELNKIWNQKELIKHPLQEQGYGSVGCTHCTHKGAGRSGRWRDSGQSECGLHLSYFYNKKK